MTSHSVLTPICDTAPGCFCAVQVQGSGQAPNFKDEPALRADPLFKLLKAGLLIALGIGALKVLHKGRS